MWDPIAAQSSGTETQGNMSSMAAQVLIADLGEISQVIVEV